MLVQTQRGTLSVLLEPSQMPLLFLGVFLQNSVQKTFSHYLHQEIASFLMALARVFSAI